MTFLSLMSDISEVHFQPSIVVVMICLAIITSSEASFVFEWVGLVSTKGGGEVWGSIKKGSRPPRPSALATPLFLTYMCSLMMLLASFPKKSKLPAANAEIIKFLFTYQFADPYQFLVCSTFLDSNFHPDRVGELSFIIRSRIPIQLYEYLSCDFLRGDSLFLLKSLKLTTLAANLFLIDSHTS